MVRPRQDAQQTESSHFCRPFGTLWVGIRYECVLAALCIRRLLQKTLIEADFKITNCIIQNIVAHAEIAMPRLHKLDIQAIYESHSMLCTYQKKMFPGRCCPLFLHIICRV